MFLVFKLLLTFLSAGLSNQTEDEGKYRLGIQYHIDTPQNKSFFFLQSLMDGRFPAAPSNTVKNKERTFLLAGPSIIFLKNIGISTLFARADITRAIDSHLINFLESENSRTSLFLGSLKPDEEPCELFLIPYANSKSYNEPIKKSNLLWVLKRKDLSRFEKFYNDIFSNNLNSNKDVMHVELKKLQFKLFFIKVPFKDSKPSELNITRHILKMEMKAKADQKLLYSFEKIIEDILNSYHSSEKKTQGKTNASLQKHSDSANYNDINLYWRITFNFNFEHRLNHSNDRYKHSITFYDFKAKNASGQYFYLARVSLILQSIKKENGKVRDEELGTLSHWTILNFERANYYLEDLNKFLSAKLSNLFKRTFIEIKEEDDIIRSKPDVVDYEKRKDLLGVTERKGDLFKQGNQYHTEEDIVSRFLRLSLQREVVSNKFKKAGIEDTILEEPEPSLSDGSEVVD